MDTTWLATKFEEHRSHLRSVAYRMLGTTGEAEEAVQETWIRLNRSNSAAVDNLGGWLTTITARVCLDILRARVTRQRLTPEPGSASDGNPERDLQLADSIGAALVVVLDTLAPAERVAFVLHDMFDLPYEEIARIIDRSEVATRQLASRARRRIQRRDATSEPGRAARGIVDAFLVAAREGNLDALLAVLDPEVVLRADEQALRTAEKLRKTHDALMLEPEIHGATAVAEVFKGRAAAAVRATIDGMPGAAWAHDGRVLSVFVFAIEGDTIRELDLIMEPDAIAELDIQLLDA